MTHSQIHSHFVRRFSLRSNNHPKGWGFLLLIGMILLVGCKDNYDEYREKDFDGLVTREEYKLLRCEEGQKKFIQSTDPILVKAYCAIYPNREQEEDMSAEGIKSSECLDYDNLNYTTLDISREDFKKLECYRQRSWINMVCFPDNCNLPNPPVCNSFYPTMCYDEDDPIFQYKTHIYINNEVKPNK